MIAGLYTYAATALVAAAVAAGGAWKVQEWRWGAKEADRLQAEQQAAEAVAADARQQRKFNDAAAGRHAAAVASLNTQLGDARAHIARLSDRQCLDAGTVRVLNNIGGAGGLGLRATPGQPAPAAAAPAGSAPDGYASERDTAAWIAACRSQYAQMSDQLNQILDIEDRREQGHAPLSGPGRE